MQRITSRIRPMSPIGPLTLALLLCCASLTNAQYTAYHGNLHSHTSYSDGVGTPPQAYHFARRTAQIDFLAITDHSGYLEDNPSHWATTRATADDSTQNGAFVAIAGYEWTSNVFNHCNVFNTTTLIPESTESNFSLFCQYLLDLHPAFASFNHPGYDGDWNALAYMGTAVDSAFPMIEMRSSFDPDSYLTMAVDSGWHVSPTTNQDNHEADWGLRYTNRTGIWATALTRADLFAGILARRTFATYDSNATIWIDLNGQDMGSRMARAMNMSLHLRLSDADGETWYRVEVFAEDGRIFYKTNRPAGFDTTFTFTPWTTRWVYAKATQSDYEETWSGPIWLTGMPLSTVAEVPPERMVSLFPNPTTGLLRLTRDVPLRLYSLEGVEVTSRVRRVSAGVHDLSALPDGVYRAVVEGGSVTLVLYR